MPSKDEPTAGVVGLGDIGRGVATNIARAGIPLSVCDLRADAVAPFATSAHVAASPRELATTSDVLFVSVLDDAQVLEVMDGDEGFLRSGTRGSVVVILSTVTLRTLNEICERAAKQEVDVVDCSVTGGPEAASDGSLVGMLGGDTAVIERVRPVVDSFCELVVNMGPLGSGLKAKLARNLVQYASWLAAYEGQVLAEAAGIELSKLAEVIRVSDKKIGGASRLMFRPTVAPFAPEDDPRIVKAMSAGAALALKDLRAALELAGSLEVRLPLAEMTEARAEAVFGLAPDPLRQGAGGSKA
jgi:3-hydroxyisobutyrate dehydrogenase-like beta-hydroxyacid dehydrogenase